MVCSDSHLSWIWAWSSDDGCRPNVWTSNLKVYLIGKSHELKHQGLTTTYCSNSVSIPAHIHQTCLFPSFDGILESSSSLFPTCEIAAELVVIDVPMKQQANGPYLGQVTHCKSSLHCHGSSLPVPQAAPILGSTMGHQLHLSGP